MVLCNDILKIYLFFSYEAIISERSYPFKMSNTRSTKLLLENHDQYMENLLLLLMFCFSLTKISLSAVVHVIKMSLPVLLHTGAAVSGQESLVSCWVVCPNR